MKKLYAILIIHFFVFPSFGQIPILNWAGILHSDSVSVISEVVTDDNQNIYIGGSFITNVDFNMGPGTNILSANGTDSYIAKYNAQHMQIWAFKFGAAGEDRVDRIILSDDGFLYVTGVFSGTVNLDPFSNFTLTSFAQKDAYVAKYDLNGALIWAKQFGGSSGICQLRNITFDEAQNLLVSGYALGTVDMDPGPSDLNFTSAVYDPIFFKLSTNGDLIWAKQLVGSNFGQITEAQVKDDGSIFMTGFAKGNIDVDPGPGTQMIPAGDTTDGFILKYNSAGDFQWMKQPQTQNEVFAHTISFMQNGDLLVGGKFKNSADFDPNAGTQMISSNGDRDYFLLRLTESGDFVSVKRIGGSHDEYITKVLVDSQDNIYIGGYFLDTINVDPDASNFSLISNNSLDILLMKLDNTGSLDWAFSIGGTGADVLRKMHVGSDDRLYINGGISALVDFDPSSSFSNLVCTGYRNDFVWVLEPANLGMNESKESRDFTISPNPNDGQFKITFSSQNAYSEVQILNSLGQLTHTEIISPNTSLTEVLLPELKDGLYFIRMNSAHGIWTETKKIIIKK